MPSASDLAVEVLRDLSVVAGNELPADHDRAYVAGKWTSQHAQLVEDGLADFDADDIPQGAFQACVDLVKARVSSQYGMAPPYDPDDPLNPARQALQRQMSTPSTYEIIPMESL